ncbi:MAG: Uma2 family endonuclease [Chloroflexota bacterium]
MSIKELTINSDLPLSKWPLFYKEGLPFIYDDEPLLYAQKGERLGDPPRHSELAIYLHELLVWIYRKTTCTITFNLTFQAETSREDEAIADSGGSERSFVKVTPDLAVIKNVAPSDSATYLIGPNNPPPDVVFEIASPSIFKEDLGRKVQIYEKVVQAQEYFSYDPHLNRLWQGSRIKGWRLVEGEYVALEPDEEGRVWSETLESWLVEEGARLGLYANDGQKRLSFKEQNEVILTETEQLKVTVQVTQDYTEQLEKVIEQERRKAELLAERLRQFDPNIEI